MIKSRDYILTKLRQARHAESEAQRESEITQLGCMFEEHMRGPQPTGLQVNASIADPNLELNLFKDHAIALGSTVDIANSAIDIPKLVSQYLELNGLPSAKPLVIWKEIEDLNLNWNDYSLKTIVKEADSDDLVGITTVFCAIAETGTIAVSSGIDTPSRNSLLPETHIALVHQSKIVANMEQCWMLLRSILGFPRALNLISGPSRTADIEQTLVIGAHGPYRVHIIIYS